MFNTRFVPLRTIAFCACLLSSPLLCGCGGGSSTPATPVNTGPVTSAPRTFGNLQFTLSADKAVYKVGDSVHFTLVVKNTGTQAIDVVTAAPNSDAIVTSNGTVVWHYADTVGVVGTSVSEGNFNPGTTGSTLFTWTASAAGTYTLTAWYNPVSLSNISFGDARTDLAANPVQIIIHN